MVSGLPFKSLIYFKLTYVKGIRVQFYSFAYVYPVFAAPFIEEIILSPFFVLSALVKD